MQEPQTELRPVEEERIGIFPSWKWVYLSVIIYTAVLVLLLYLLTNLLDHSVS